MENVFWNCNFITVRLLFQNKNNISKVFVEPLDFPKHPESIKMMNKLQKKKLFAEFNPASQKEFLEKALQELKGKDFDSLVSQSYEKIDIKPIYNQGDMPANPIVFSGLGTWENREKIEVVDINNSNHSALEAIQKGADSLQFDLTHTEIQPIDFKKLLAGINLKTQKIGFTLGKGVEEFLKAIEGISFQGNIQYDFLAEWTTKGIFPESGFENLVRLIHFNKGNLRTLLVNAQNFHNAGANAVQELAFGLSTAVEYIHQLTERGISATDCFQNIEFSFSIGSNYFTEIAKFRAARGLFGLLLKAYQVEKKNISPLNIHAETARWNKTLTDIDMNMLRNTTEAMAALIGTADAISVNPFNSISGETDEFARRISRNVATILKAESHLDKVSDIGAGTYYIESLTQELVQKAWDLFLKTEQEGGFIQAFEKGFIQREIQEVANLKIKNFKEGRDILVGTNKYENKKEQVITSKTKDVKTENLSFPLLKLQRLSEDFEKNRG